MKDLEQSISTNPLIFNYSIYCVEKLQLYVNFLVRLANRNSEICQENIDEKSLLEVYRAIVLSIYDIRHGIHRRHKKQLVDF
ncbi:MAG: hypothetical protein HWD59_09090 [Coxiellaceae bacterium]|nr:MAG: hypothetical protein HWD59_09090 [Coxiellaceae bacterium]